MKNIQRYFFAAILLLAGNVCFAQDPTFSQFNLNQLYYNPAYTGDHRGYQLTATYRSLWPNVPGKVFPGPLSTYYGYFDAFLSSGSSYTAGAGIFAMQNIEGEGFLKTTTFGVSYAQHFAKLSLGTQPRNQLSLGFKAYVNSISIHWDKLVFSDQLDIENGITGYSAFAQNGVSQKFTTDLDAGLLFKNNFRGKDNWYNEVGFSMAHILSPNISLTDSETKESHLPQKFTGSFRTTVGVKEKAVFIGSTILFENQKDFYALNTGFDLYSDLTAENSVMPLWFSLMHRTALHASAENTNAFIGSIKYKWLMGKYYKAVYFVGFSADFPYTGLGMKSKGAYELTLGVILPRNGSNHFSRCPFSTF